MHLTEGNQPITGGMFYCRDSAGVSVSASNKFSCNLTEQRFPACVTQSGREIGNKNIPPIR
jgi:hypothetical protein